MGLGTSASHSTAENKLAVRQIPAPIQQVVNRVASLRKLPSGHRRFAPNAKAATFHLSGLYNLYEAEKWQQHLIEMPF